MRRIDPPHNEESDIVYGENPQHSAEVEDTEKSIAVSGPEQVSTNQISGQDKESRESQPS